ncbi:MAG TPA: penicillin acylase family protein [Gammaproteobacteria bacterium]|jgi:penicillin amidase|nr:penicillin acylase family protein [Gammaproteobacteria bacterium]
MRRALRWGGYLAVLVVVLLLLVYGFLRGGAPRLDGELRLKGFASEVRVTRDALGVPSIAAQQRLDAIRALGFLHAQDRFFQMDLMRRLAAGELSELVGGAAVDFDKRHRLFRLRAVAQDVLAHATPEQRAGLAAYSEGVNAGLKALGTWPFEYGLLMTRPKPWQPEDSILVVHAMYFQLQSPEDHHESQLALMRDLMPPAMFRFLTAPGTQWDAPVQGKPIETPPIPGADVADLRKRVPTKLGALSAPDDALAVGSNNWVVSGEHSSTGAALLANDMHLGIRVPNTWYRAQWTYPGKAGPVTLTGVTLPGVPAMVVGSNGHVAWGYTNSYGDWSDLVLLHLDPADADRYQTAEGWRRFTHHAEIIHVKGGKDVSFDIKDTVWGPVLDQDHAGVTRAVHWMAADPAGTNLELEHMEDAQDVREAMAVANRAGMPEQNFVTADSAGHVAWTIAGRIPLRAGFDPAVPSYWDKPGTGWAGWLDPAKYPRVVDPADGRLWSANARVVEGPMLTLIGDGGYDLGARAGQIRDDLRAKDRFTPADMLAIQLDDRALFLARWRSLLLRVLNPQRVADHPERAAFRQAVEEWGGRAAVDSVGYRLVREFRGAVTAAAVAPLFADCIKADPHCDYHGLSQLEGPVWALINQQPANLLDPAYKSWDALLLAAVDEVAARTAAEPGIGAYTWGAHNTVHLTHPLSRAVPFLSRFLDMAPVQLPGDSNMPRVQGEDFGASERMVVSPGHEAEGILEMPTGQSGYPLSPYYRNSEPDWEQGRPTPFLPGAAEHTLVFEPGK